MNEKHAIGPARIGMTLYDVLQGIALSLHVAEVVLLVIMLLRLSELLNLVSNYVKGGNP